LLAVLGSRYTVPDLLKSHLQQNHPENDCSISAYPEQYLAGAWPDPLKNLALRL